VRMGTREMAGKDWGGGNVLGGETRGGRGRGEKVRRVPASKGVKNRRKRKGIAKKKNAGEIHSGEKKRTDPTKTGEGAPTEYRKGRTQLEPK